MLLDRPRVVKTLYHGTAYATVLNVYDYFLTQNTGLCRKLAASSGSAQWVVTAGSGGLPGCLQFLFISVTNTSGVTKDYGARVYMNGGYVYTNNSLTIATGTQTGICLAGKVWFSGAGAPSGVAMSEIFHDDAMTVEVWVDDPSIIVATSFKHYTT